MDIDIQTLIQQDIDLGIKKSLNYDPTFGTTSTGEFDFLKFLNENSSSAKIEPSVDFYLRQQLEIQKVCLFDCLNNNHKGAFSHISIYN